MPSQRTWPRRRCRLPSTAPPRDRACPRPTVPCPVTELRTDRPRTPMPPRNRRVVYANAALRPAGRSPMPSRSRQPRAPMTPRPDSSIAAARIAAAGHRCIPRMGSGETWQKRAFWTLSRLEVRLCWQDATAIRPQAVRHGNKYPQCVLGRLAMAIYRRYAFLNVQQWQFFRSMHPRRGLGRENHQFAARFARHASKTSWLWQDMRAVYPKSPANRLLGMHSAKILPGRGPFAAQAPRIMHGAQIFPRFSVRKVLRAESKMNWVLQVHFALPPTVPPCDVTARLWQPPRLVGSQCGGAYVRPSCARPQQPSLPALLGIRLLPHGAVRPMAAACPMGILLLSSCLYPFSRQRFSSTQRTKKRPAERWSLWQFVALAVRELCADYSARSFRRRSSSSAS